jgi:CubicO group peptidase (beta-lactamase class C family)
MTKSFTAAVVLGLRDEGIVSLERPVADYAPELASVVGPHDSVPIALRHLLSMSAGMATDDAWADRHLDASEEFMNEVYASGVHFAGATGDVFEYSNLGFAMIGRVIHRVTGRRLQDHVDERLIGPLGLSRTSWVRPSSNVVDPYRVRDGVPIDEGVAPLGDGEIAPMGGLWSTVADLARWVAWLDEANSGRDSATGRLRPSSRREMQHIQNYIGASSLDSVSAPSGYGFGLLVRDDPALGSVVGHSGGLPGYGSNMRWWKGSGVGVIGLANVTYAPMATFTHRALNAVHQAGLVPATEAEGSPLLESRARSLLELLTSWNDESARALFADNVEPDEPFERLAADARQRLGGQRAEIVEVRATNATSGTMIVSVGGRTIELELALSPFGGSIQEYTWKAT